MPNKANGIILAKGGDFKAIERDIIPAESGDNFALVEVEYLGGCPSDIDYTKQAYKATWPGLAIGHEGVVRSHEDGQLYIINPLKPCGKCKQCRSGKENICNKVRFLGVVGKPEIKRPQVEGLLQGKFYWPKELLHPIPHGVDPITATMCEPLSCAMHAVNKAELQPSDDILVLGTGQMGILIAMILKLHRMPNVLVIGRNKSRNLLAREIIGPDIYIGRSFRDKYANKKFDIVFDCVGNTESVDELIYKVEPGGRIILMGNYSGNDGKVVENKNYYVRTEALQIPSRRFTSKEFQIAAGQLPLLERELKKIIHPKLFPLTVEGITEAFELARSNRNIIKVVMGRGDGQ